MGNNIELHMSHGRIFDEAIDRVAVKLKALKIKDNSNVFMFVGASAGIGTTTVSFCLADSMARAGWKTVFVDCDMRRAVNDKFIKTDTEKGLVNYLDSGEKDYRGILQRTDNENLYYVCTGEKTDNPIKYLSKPEMAEFIKELKSQYEFVIVDTPPAGIYNDAELLMPFVDRYVLVAAVNETTKKELYNSRLQFADYESKYAGTVLNRVEKRQYNSIIKDYSGADDTKNRKKIKGKKGSR